MTIAGLLNLWPPFSEVSAPPVEPPPDPEPDTPALGYAVLTNAQGNKARLEVG